MYITEIIICTLIRVTRICLHTYTDVSDCLFVVEADILKNIKISEDNLILVSTDTDRQTGTHTQTHRVVDP